MGKSLFYSMLVLVWTASAAFAMDGCGAGPCASCHSLSLKEANELLHDVGEVKKVEPAPVKGLWRLELARDGRQGVVFMDFGKKNLIAGTVFPLAPKNEVGKPMGADSKVARVDVASIPVDNSIVMGNPSGKKRLFVFTDPDCPFCGKMHGELKKLVALEPDLAVYIKLFPLKMHPGAYDKARVILGRKSLELLEKSFSGQKLPASGEKDPAKPVDDSLKFAESVGINSTPTLVLPDGRLLSGYRDAAALQKLLAGK